MLRRLGAVAVVAVLAITASGCLIPPRFTVTPVVTGLTNPWDVGFASGTMIYTERPGRISAFVGGQKRLLAAPADVIRASEAGMMGLAVDPQFAANRYIFTCHASTLGAAPGDVRVVRWRVNDDFTGLTDRTDIITGAPVNPAGELGRHSGCRPRFGPDGNLWIGTGDAAIGTAPQSRTSLGGKILRVDRNGNGVAGNQGGGFDPRVYSYGHRNTQGIAFRSSDGLAVSVEHGSTQDDELNRLTTGNFGWNPVPGYNEAVPMTDLAEFPDAVRALWRSGTPTIAPSGATFLEGAQWKGWQNALAMAVLKDKKLQLFGLNAQGGVTGSGVAITDRGRLRTAVQGPDGNLYISTDNGGTADVILRVVPQP
ncbi:MAG: PQQ-dependent sugar dehydrogenase [Thermoleophilaceae bacterium]|nr:PQQ-dependent sugar dehydrogenase [Thermoleophilaceae bacterium]